MTSSERDTSENEILQNNLNPEQIFPFALDEFQLKAIDSLNQGHSVVVSAPTGSGKTLIGEYAIYRAISHGSKVFYTTPLKALSNQKLRDFRNQFGSSNVGLLTGDLSLNREASILVMTTEIFRNMLYAAADRNDDPLLDIETVVLDECHYMNDAHRGTVWEESIIHCPKSVQFVALSATVANAGQLTDWIEQVHGPTDLISSDLRPVPLEFNFCSAKGLHPLLNDKGTGLHPNCKIWRPSKSHKKRGRLSKPSQPESPSLGFVISKLAERNMLPAIYFIFSRRGCDKAVKTIANTCLVKQEERKLIQDRFDTASHSTYLLSSSPRQKISHTLLMPQLLCLLLIFHSIVKRQPFLSLSPLPLNWKSLCPFFYFQNLTSEKDSINPALRKIPFFPKLHMDTVVYAAATAQDHHTFLL